MAPSTLPTPPATLFPLLDHLAQSSPQQPEGWGAWQVTPVLGGRNNRLYRARCEEADYAIKFTLRDERRRAEREFNALTVLQQLPEPVAPAPVLLDDHYPNPVVVQQWVEGTCPTTIPNTEGEWLPILQGLARFHRLTPGMTSLNLPDAVSTAYTVPQTFMLVQRHLGVLPPEVHPPQLSRLIPALEQKLQATQFQGPITLCHCDPNLGNWICHPAGWRLVDWENSGWGDPAFEIADMITHPSFIGVPDERWQWVTSTYSQLVQDPMCQMRIEAYAQILLLWWVARLARYLYEVPRLLDERLAARPPDWEADMRQKYAHYLSLAGKNLESADFADFR